MANEVDEKTTFIILETTGPRHKFPIMHDHMLTRTCSTCAVRASFNKTSLKSLAILCAFWSKITQSVSWNAHSREMELEESFGNCQEIFIGNIWKTAKGITLT